MNRERIKGHLDLLLLSVLAAGPAHGYAIISALRERSEGTFDLPEGTIYPALHRLEDVRAAQQFLGGGGRAAAPRLRADRRRGGRPGRRADRMAPLRGRHPRGGRVVDVNPSGDLIEDYLDRLQASLRTTPRETRRIIAEAEDHLREGVADGRAAGLTEREAQEAAISSFGSVSAVVRAHQRRFPPAAVLGELVMAAWKLSWVLLLTVAASGVVALAMDLALGRRFVGGNPNAATLSASQCHYWLSIWPSAHTCRPGRDAGSEQ